MCSIHICRINFLKRSFIKNFAHHSSIVEYSAVDTRITEKIFLLQKPKDVGANPDDGTWEYSEIGITFVSRTKVFDSNSDIPISSFGAVIKHTGLSSR